MSEPDPNKEGENGGGPSTSPGDRLQAARISIGLTVEEVAAKMHLSPAVLTNLEENEFDEITAPIFVKGYLRSYARIVRLDEDEIIQQYVRFHAGGDPPISSTSNTAREINAGDLRVRGVTWIVIFVLFGLLALWWWNRYQQPAQPVSLDSGEPAPAVIIEPVESKAESLVNAESMPNVAEPMTDPVINGIEVGEIAAQAPEAMDSGASIAPTDTGNTAVIASETAPIAVEQESNQIPPAVSASVESEPRFDLVIIVNADTWTDIRDADGTKLVYDLLRAGERIELDGKKPFNAFFGNAYGVEINYQGEKIDFSSRIRADNTARVSIGR